MDLLREKIGKVYFGYLAAAFGSAMISCIYGMVDMAVVGRYQGPQGTAALAIVAPVWNIIYSLGLLTGIGGSVLFGSLRASANDGRENEYFTVSMIFSAVLSVLSLAAIWFFERPLLIFFGGSDEALSALAERYLLPVKFTVPLFLFNQTLAAFLRNDNAPALAAAAVLAGGIFNVFGDVFFTFTLDMGIFGAGLATSIGAAVSFSVMLTHFVSRKNTLRFVRPRGFLRKVSEISASGFSAFFSDVAMGILTVVFNRQIMKYLDADALAIYGPIINISTFVQCCAYSAGQAAQPVLSANFGAAKYDRIRDTLKCALGTVAFFGVFWTALSCIFPRLYVYIFMTPTAEILARAPFAIRAYSLSFLLLPLNVFSAYYFQSIMRPKIAFVVSVARGLVVSGALLFILPLFSPDALWFSMPITELLTAAFVVFAMRRYPPESSARRADVRPQAEN